MLCSSEVASVLQTTRGRIARNTNAINTQPEGQLDPIIGIPVLTIFSLLLLSCLLTVGIGLWGRVLLLQKVYFGILMVLTVNSTLQIVCWTIFMSGVAIWANYFTLRAVNNHVELLIMTTAVIVFLVQW
jgi:hypothetical protein